MPSKPKTKLKKGKAWTPSPRKQPRKAARKAQACAACQEPDVGVIEEHFMDNEVLTDPSQGLASHLDTMLDMTLALSQKVNGQAEVVHEHEDTPSTSLPNRPLVKRSRATKSGLPSPRLHNRPGCTPEAGGEFEASSPGSRFHV